MQPQSIKELRLIKMFANKFLDKRSSAYQGLKTMDSRCREAIEKVLNENSELKALIPQHSEHDAWIKELVVNYILLKMHHHALLWEIDDHEPRL